MAECQKKIDSNSNHRGTEPTFLSLDLSGQAEESSRLYCSHKSKKRLRLTNLPSSENEEELSFISLSKCYEALLNHKQAQSRKSYFKRVFLKSSKDDKIDYVCICFKSFKLANNLIAHIEHNHLYSAESMSYLKVYQLLKRYNLESKMIKLAADDYLTMMQGRAYHLLRLPEEMIPIVSLPDECKLKVLLKELLRFDVKIDNFYFQIYNGRLNFKKNFFFSQEFMENIRQLAVKHIVHFDRRIKMHLKNMRLQEVVFIFAYKISRVLEKIKEEEKPKGAKAGQIFELSNLFECISWHFLNWVDSNYKKVLDKLQISYIHVELQENERYSSIERLWKFQIFVQSYFDYMSTKYLGVKLSKVIKFWLESLQRFASWVREDDFSRFEL